MNHSSARIAAAVGGPDGWRWAFVALSIPPVIVGLASIRLKEPVRGGADRLAIFGTATNETADSSEGAEDLPELPVSISQAFSRLQKVKTFYFLAVGVGVLGFGDNDF